MTSGIRAAAWFVAAAASSACADASSPASTTVTDSAGIRIVGNPSGSIEAAPSWSLSEGPVVAIGSGADPDVPLTEVAAVVPLGRGRVAVGMNRPPQALIFGADGALAATLGREGEGPGEFSRITSGIASVVPLGADSVAVWDQNRRRMSVFTEDGSYARGVDLSTTVPPSPIVSSNVSALSAFTYLLPADAESLVLFAVGVFGPGDGVRRVGARSFRIGSDGEDLATYGPFPGAETFMSSQLGAAPLPFGADTYGATAGDALVVGTAEVPEFRLYRPDGTLESIVRWPDHERSIGGPILSRWNDFVDDWLSTMPPGNRRGIREILDGMPRPERFPAYDGIVATDDGEIWVGEYAGPLTMPGTPLDARVPARRWLVFGADGALAATVRTPEGFQPYAVRDRLVWGVFRDELDVESVQAFELSGN